MTASDLNPGMGALQSPHGAAGEKGMCTWVQSVDAYRPVHFAESEHRGFLRHAMQKKGEREREREREREKIVGEEKETSIPPAFREVGDRHHHWE
jgi:hypothetical protein